MFSYYQESKSAKIMDTFKELMPPKARVMRDGQTKILNVTDLVIGDIVWLETGDRVPADIRLLECQGSFSIYKIIFICFFFLRKFFLFLSKRFES